MLKVLKYSGGPLDNNTYIIISEDPPEAAIVDPSFDSRRIWPEVDRFGRARVIYVQDPDGNVVELLDKPPADIAGALLRWFPEATP